MKIWASIEVNTFNNTPTCNYGHLYISDEAGKLEISVKVDYEDAKALMYKLAEQLGKAPEHSINRFNSSISMDEVSGYIDRE